MLKSANWLALMCSLSPSSTEAYRFVLLPTDNTINLCNSGSAVRWRVSVGSDPKSRCCYWEACGRAGGSQTFLIKKKTHLIRGDSWVIELIYSAHRLISFDTTEIHENINQWEYSSGWMTECVCVCSRLGHIHPSPYGTKKHKCE